MPNAIVLENVSKIHPLRKARGRSLKQLALSLFRKREEAEVVRAADDVSLEIPEGQALGIIGPNGAGKTTLLSLIAGITPPTSGKVRARGRVLPLLELGAGFHPELSGYENILLQGSLLGLGREKMRELLPAIIEFSELDDFIYSPIKHYSSGMVMRLGFAVSVHVDPDILLIDEAFAVGDLYFQKKCLEKMSSFHRRGGTYLIVTHSIALVEQVCDKVIWMDKGRIVREGAPSEVAHQYKKEMFESSYPRPIPLEHRKQASISSEGRYGNGRVTFEFLDICDEDGAINHTFEHGRPMRIRMRYHAHEPVEDMHCFVYIQSGKGHGAACMSTYALGEPVRPHPEGGEVVFRIPRLDLTPGNYQIIASINSGDVETERDLCDLHVRVEGFMVVGPPVLSPIAGLDLPAEWEHLPKGGAGSPEAAAS